MYKTKGEKVMKHKRKDRFLTRNGNRLILGTSSSKKKKKEKESWINMEDFCSDGK